MLVQSNIDTMPFELTSDKPLVILSLCGWTVMWHGIRQHDDCQCHCNDDDGIFCWALIENVSTMAPPFGHCGFLSETSWSCFQTVWLHTHIDWYLFYLDGHEIKSFPTHSWVGIHNCAIPSFAKLLSLEYHSQQSWQSLHDREEMVASYFLFAPKQFTISPKMVEVMACPLPVQLDRLLLNDLIDSIPFK